MNCHILQNKYEAVKSPDITSILNEILKSRKSEVEEWFSEISKKTPPFFYNSVDLRHSGFKLAPVDTNLFPAGFNNLSKAEKKHAVEIAKNFFDSYYPNIKNILLVAEDHTRNKYYLENISTLKNILTASGCNIEISNFSATALGENVSFESMSGEELIFKPLIKKNNLLQTADGFIADMVIVNNDLTSGAPEILQNIDQQVSPPIGFGWYQRRKTSHFETYNNMAREFCQKFNIDPWLISTYFQRCGVVNFKEKKGIECVAIRVEKTLNKIRTKYKEYGINEEPYVFIKSDRGTYGMGIMTAKSSDEVYEMGKNIRKKMNTIKGGITNTEVIIQEGVPTVDTVDDHPAEPMMYMLGAKPVGCIYRLNTKKDTYGNLNASGMAFASINQYTDENMCDAYGLISKLASHAAAWECYVESYNI